MKLRAIELLSGGISIEQSAKRCELKLSPSSAGWTRIGRGRGGRDLERAVPGQTNEASNNSFVSTKDVAYPSSPTMPSGTRLRRFSNKFRTNKENIELHFLPNYSPEFNTTEWGGRKRAGGSSQQVLPERRVAQRKCFQTIQSIPTAPEKSCGDAWSEVSQ